MPKTTVLILSAADEPQLALLAALRDTANLVIGDSPKSFESAAAQAEVILNWLGSLPLFCEVFMMSRNLRWIHSRSVGLDSTLFPELVSSDVILTTSKGVFSASLAEFALAAILYFAKDFRRMIRSQMAGVWDQFDVNVISGQTVGIVGYGDIGRAVAERVRVMGMKVLAVKRHVSTQAQPDPSVDEVFGPDRLRDMLPLCDYIVVAAPLNDETRGMIDEAQFALMKKSAVIINLGRGPVINEKAMVKALSLNRIKGAALDVFDEEPLPQGHLLYKLENVLLSPHCADHTAEWLNDAMRFFIAQFERFRRGQPLLNIVDKKLGY